MTKIEIVSFLLTRRCNLRCSYCGIASNKIPLPSTYPGLVYYKKSELSTDKVCDILYKLHHHNPNVFIIFYGGEPLLREDLPRIIGVANSLNLQYTIITNGSIEAKNGLDSLFKITKYISGLTCSIDPIITDKNYRGSHRTMKTISGMNTLLDYKTKVKDIVAEITADSSNIEKLPGLVETLTMNGISSDITVIDDKKSVYYDFASNSCGDLLVHKTPLVKEVFQKLIESNLDIHMKDILLPEIYDILPSSLNCDINKNLHNLTIDADGSIRLCLRIRGVYTPKKTFFDYFNAQGEYSMELLENISIDKSNYCLGCNWTCMLMSKRISENNEIRADLIHKDKREESN